MSTGISRDSPDLAQAKQLLDKLKEAGFRFKRTAPGEDGPLLGLRASGQWVDTVYFEGFSSDCMAWRQRRSLLIVPGGSVIERQVSGGALAVLGEVVTWKKDS
ncbi:MAG: hypothetical protein LC808_28170 [Actinobacteria bacterium]|nr:hypothetical protein [Actinomycetota bacterium]